MRIRLALAMAAALALLPGAVLAEHHETSETGDKKGMPDVAAPAPETDAEAAPEGGEEEAKEGEEGAEAKPETDKE
jgi:predicted cobalt transporter CbtA